MLKPYSASSFCLPNKNRVGVAHGDGTNLEVVYTMVQKSQKPLALVSKWNARHHVMRNSSIILKFSHGTSVPPLHSGGPQKLLQSCSVCCENNLPWNPVNKYPPKISTPSFFPEICCRLQCPESTYPPNISTPVSWKYVHNRWNMHNSVFSTEITRLNRLLPCWIFHPALSYPPKVSMAPENKYLHRR